MEKIKLKKGEVSCNKCNGMGLFCFVESKYVTINYCNERQCLKDMSECNGFKYQHCPKCHGTGKLDWIENVVGKHKNYQLWYAPYIPMVFTRKVNGRIERSSNYKKRQKNVTVKR